jgi:hypothetical protein
MGLLGLLRPPHDEKPTPESGGRGNGDYRDELASALQAITTYLKHFALLPQVALVRKVD